MEEYSKKLLIGTLLGISIGYGTWNYIIEPLIEPIFFPVQTGYINSNEMKISCRNDDHIPGCETILRIDNTPYSLRYDENHKPVLELYQLPAE